MRIARTLPDPKDPRSIVEYLSRVQRVVDGGIEFGNPNDPKDPSSTTRADGASHNGTLVNVAGSYVEILVEATGRTTHTCTHNLSAQSRAGSVNVRWQVHGIIHDGTGADATTEYRLTTFYLGGTISSSAIQLGVSLATAGTAPTINASHPIKVTLFFTEAVR